MINKIRNRINKELRDFTGSIDKTHTLSEISPFLYKGIKDYILRGGKRIRPVLFVVGYLGFAKKVAKNLYTSALSIELLHDFMLIHDDIIDKSDLRRGKPSLHVIFNNYLKAKKNVKFNGEDLAIVSGDILYALAINAFLAIKEDPIRKERALKKFVETAIFTGTGEFIELLCGIKGLDEITKEDIYKIYDYKTAHYTFACPLSIGAILAGAGQKEISKLTKYGIYAGRAFQIKDDILGMFSKERVLGKSILSDLREAKKTLLVWQAYHNSDKKQKLIIKNIFSKNLANQSDLLLMRKIIIASGALDYANKEISSLITKAGNILQTCSIKTKYHLFLQKYPMQLFVS